MGRFPADISIEDIATLAPPHQGVLCDDDPDDGRDDCPNNRQWLQMDPDSAFIDALQQEDRKLDDPRADGIEWSLAGSDEEDVASYDSAIDSGNHTDQKYGLTENLTGHAAGCSDPALEHSAIREETGGGGFCLRLGG